MIKRLSALLLAVLLLLSTAGAEFYTANPDVYYHADANCVAGSTYEISEAAARQFEKIPCPVCVNRASVGGEIVEITLPEGYGNFSLQDVDFKDGKILLCGFVDRQNDAPWMAMYDLQGNKLQESFGKATDELIREAKFLADGKIALICSIGGAEGKWHIQLFEDGQMARQSEGTSYLGRLWATQDGFLVYGGPELYQYQLAKCDLEGNILWTMDLDMFPLSDGQPGLSDILTGDNIHIAYGRTAQADGTHRPVLLAFDDNGNILAREKIERVLGTSAKTLYDSDMNPTGYAEVDSYLSRFVDAVWTNVGAIFAGGDSLFRYDSEGESWFIDLSLLWDENENLLLDGKAVEGGYVTDMIPWNGGCLLAMTVDVYTPYLGSADEPAGKGYVHIAEISPEGKIVRDWFEEISDIVSGEEIRLFTDGDNLYLFAEGETMIPMRAYEEGYPAYKIPRKAILKRISA